MIFKQKEFLDPKLKQQLKDYVYEPVGWLMDVYKELPCGLPEYIYQEAIARVLTEKGQVFHKEMQYHPIFRGKPLEAYLKMDLVLEKSRGNIIVECKAIENLGPHERQQLFSYMVASQFPIGILINFASYPKAQIEKYYFDKRDMTITAF